MYKLLAKDAMDMAKDAKEGYKFELQKCERCCFLHNVYWIIYVIYV